jgi:dTDP-glucose 4,6-dehydratase/UDP-glucose 4-epimerase
VYGSEGVLGRALTRFLAAKGHRVAGAACQPPSYDYDYVHVSREAPAPGPLLATGGFDVCVNAAGAGSVAEAARDIAGDERDTVRLNATLLAAIADHSPSCRYVLLSSAAVYGASAPPFVEGSTPESPVSAYGRHKLQAEQTCMEHAAKRGIPVVRLRVFSAYGAGMRKQLFWDLVRKVRAGGFVELFGSGEECRDFVEVRDVCGAVERVVLGASFKGEAINVATGSPVTIRSAASCFLAQVGRDPRELRFNGVLRQGDPRDLVADNARLKSIGFEAQVSLAQGLQDYWEWARGLPLD